MKCSTSLLVYIYTHGIENTVMTALYSYIVPVCYNSCWHHLQNYIDSTNNSRLASNLYTSQCVARHARDVTMRVRHARDVTMRVRHARDCEFEIATWPQLLGRLRQECSTHAHTVTDTDYVHMRFDPSLSEVYNNGEGEI